MLQYREMKIEDYDSAVKLWEQTDEIFLTIGDSKEEIELYLNHNPGLGFVCFDDEADILAGTILCGHDGRRGFIYHLAVRKEYRNRSLGKKLLSLSLDKLKEKGIKRCMVMVKSFNNDAGKFWKHSGWDERDDLKMYSKNLE